MKNLIAKTMFYLVVITNFSLSQVLFSNLPEVANVSPGELIIYNHTEYWNQHHNGPQAYHIIVKILPVGAFFNGQKKYTSDGLTTAQAPYSNKITGGQFVVGYNSATRFLRINFDDIILTTHQDCKLNIGLGLYRIEFWDTNFTQLLNYVYIDWRDSEFRGGILPNYPNILDIRIDYFSSDSITFQHYPHNPDSAHYFYYIYDVNRTIKMWEIHGTFLDPLPFSKGLFYPDSSHSGEFLSWPINANRYNGNIGFENPGDLGMNIVINHNVTTQDTALGNGNIYIPEYGFLKIASDKTFNMKKPKSGFHNLVVQDSSLLWLDAGSLLIVDTLNRLTLKPNGTIKLGHNSEIVFEPSSLFCNEGGAILIHELSAGSGFGKITMKKGYHQFNCAQLLDFVFGDSIKLVLSDSVIFEIPDSTMLHFTGNESGLIMSPNSKLKIGMGSKILFENSAKLIADSAEFCSINSSNTWEGIVLENSSFDTIKNCTFSNAKSAISILNAEGASYYRRIIQNNIFNVPTGGNYKGIYGENNYRILVKDNTFNMPVVSGSFIYTGLYLKNSTISTTAPEAEEPEPLYTMNVIHNTFNYGSASIILANYISSVSSYYIANNTFNNCSEINLLGMKINGKIKNNNFTSSSVPMGVHLINSYPDMFNNSILARDVSLHLAGHCYPNLAPDLYGGDMYWSGGMNSFSADEIDNIQLSSSGNVYTDWGNNSFNIENTNSFHIYGLVDSTLTGYHTRNNCWSPDDFTKIYLKTYYDTSALANLYFTQGYDCESITPTGTQTNFIGSEMYDTLTVSDDNSGSVLSDEEILYAQGKHYMSFDYVGAITTYKYLIDNYPDFENTSASAEYMYECYQALDTTTDTSYRNTLYGNLKIYLEERIESGEHSGDFIDVAYNIILACEAIFKNYNEALNGYEFISLFHPDPNIRLIASWDYEEVEDLINSGSGGGNQLRIRNVELGIEGLRELRDLLRLEEIINDDPIMSKMKKSYKKSSAERKEKIEKEIRSESKTSESAKENILKSSRLDNQKEDRAKRNIFESKMMNKSEKEKRRIEDMILTTRSIRNEMSKNEKISIPLEYKLEQNYPNPFNPVTTINFSIPKQSFVTLKIFDILGKEVKTLVNEVKTLVNEIKASGNYEIEFNGRNLASGVYFYRLFATGEAGEFKDIKRMILIK